MKIMLTRRSLLKTLIGAPVGSFVLLNPLISALHDSNKNNKYKLKLSLNVYSFHHLLINGDIDLWDVLDFCAQYNFDAVDPTGYYFPGYPAVPDDAYIHQFKRKSFLLGLDISGTGIRNDFANPDVTSRQSDVDLIIRWIEAAAKLGAPVLRIFPGHHEHPGYGRDEVLEWMVRDIQTCCKWAEKFGVLLAIQNHNGFLKTAADVDRLIGEVNSSWLGLNLDIGSYRQNSPYEEIKKNIHHAITWQIKENVWIDGVETPTDFPRLLQLIKSANYRGYLPLETLGPGDPFEKVPILLDKVRKSLG